MLEALGGPGERSILSQKRMTGDADREEEKDENLRDKESPEDDNIAEEVKTEDEERPGSHVSEAEKREDEEQEEKRVNSEESVENKKGKTFSFFTYTCLLLQSQMQKGKKKHVYSHIKLYILFVN